MTENSHTIDIVIYHNPACATSRNVLAMIRNAGLEPHVIEYLKTPPTRALLCQLIERAGLTARALLRQRDTPFTSLGLQDPTLPDDMLIDTMLAYPLSHQPTVGCLSTGRGTVSTIGKGIAPAALCPADSFPQGRGPAHCRGQR